MQLTPKHPPGRTNRKAREFEAQIGQWHAAGYSFASIRLILADAGVMVSRATVQREIARLAAKRTRPVAVHTPMAIEQAPVRLDAADALTAHAPHGTHPSILPTPSAFPKAHTSRPLRGKAIADEFVRQHITNPLLRQEPT